MNTRAKFNKHWFLARSLGVVRKWLDAILISSDLSIWWARAQRIRTLAELDFRARITN